MTSRAPEGFVEAVIVPATNKGVMVGAATGFVGWLTQVNWIGLIGALAAILGVLINLYFQMRRDRRESEANAAAARRADAETEARIQALRDQCRL